MGQSISSEEYQDFDIIISSILNMDFPILDIGNTIGCTDYIDFINYEQISHPIMKGYDCFKRPFFVIRGTILFNDGTTQQTLETFFQRYEHNKYLWHGCGPFKIKYFLSTNGGMTLQQIKFIEQILNLREIKLTKKYMEEIKFGCDYQTYSKTENDELLIDNNIIGFRIE